MLKGLCLLCVNAVNVYNYIENNIRHDKLIVHVLTVRSSHFWCSCSGVEPTTTVAAFQALLADRLGVPIACQELLAGFPPKLIQVCTRKEYSEDTTLLQVQTFRNA